MKTKILILIALTCLSTLNPQLPASPLGAAFTYQGQLTASGSPANGSYDLKFTLFDTNSGGSGIAGPLTNSAVAVSNGLFTATLDFGANVFTGDARWLEIAVRQGTNDFTTLSPRQALTASPHALYASSAGTASSASNLLGVLSCGQLSGLYSNAVSLNHAANQFTGSFDGNGASLTNLNATQFGGLYPSNFWRVNGNSTVAGDFLGTLNSQPLEFKVNNVRGLRLEPGGTNGSPNVIGGSPRNEVVPGTVGATIGGGGTTNYYGSAYTNRVAADFGTVSGGGGNSILTSSGYSAIGGGANNTVLRTFMYGCSTISGGEWNQIGSYAGYSTIPGGRSNYVGGIYGLAAGRNAKANHDGSFVWADSQAADFGSSGNNQFLIRAGGGVGIGKTNPATALDVAGTVTATAFSGNGSGLSSVTPADGSVTSAKLASDAASLSKVSGGSMYSSSGHIGIGLANPDADLCLYAAGPAIKLYNPTTGVGYTNGLQLSYYSSGSLDGALWNRGAGCWAFGTSDTDRMRITADGLVGIGTVSPERILHVYSWSTPASVLIGCSYTNNGFTALDLGLSAVFGGYARIQAVSAAGSYFGDLNLNPSGGKVGIGKVSPATALDVAGTVTATAFAGNGAGLTGIAPGDGSVTSAKLASDAVSLSKVSGGSMYSSSGHIGIGLADPDADLCLYGAGPAIKLYNPTTDVGYDKGLQLSGL